MEFLHLSLDNMNMEIQQLEAGNQRLWEANLEQAAEADWSTEVQQLKELYGQVLRNLQKKDEQAEESRHKLKETTESLCGQESIAKEVQFKGQ